MLDILEWNLIWAVLFVSPDVINWAEPNYLPSLTRCCHMPSLSDASFQPLDVGLCVLPERRLCAVLIHSNLSLSLHLIQCILSSLFSSPMNFRPSLSDLPRFFEW